MKKILAILTSVMMMLTITAINVNAAQRPKGIIYYRVELMKTSTLAPGTYFLSDKDTYEDLNYVSFVFPTDISDACVMVTGPLDTGSYFGKNKDTPVYNIDGFPVNVIQKDQQFDNCKYGHIFAPSTEVDANSVQKWRYFCYLGGAKDKGPYYLYSVQTANYNTTNLKAVQNKDFSNVTGVTTVDVADITISIELTAKDGTQFTNGDAKFTIDPTDNTVDFDNGDNIITLLFDGEGGKYVVRYDVKNNVFLPDPVDPEPTSLSPNTGMSTPIWIITLGVLALGTCGVLEVKKRRQD